jgi:hypothetical protein
MTIGTNPAMSDVLIYEVGYVQLRLADGSEPVAGRSYAIEDYTVDLLARYPNDVISQVRWALPAPGESTQFGEGVYGLVTADTDITGGLTSSPVYRDAQFTVAGSRCFENAEA